MTHLNLLLLFLILNMVAEGVVAGGEESMSSGHSNAGPVLSKAFASATKLTEHNYMEWYVIFLAGGPILWGCGSLRPSPVCVAIVGAGQ